jgi:hypothetical protein
MRAVAERLTLSAAVAAQPCKQSPPLLFRFAVSNSDPEPRSHGRWQNGSNIFPLQLCSVDSSCITIKSAKQNTESDCMEAGPGSSNTVHLVFIDNIILKCFTVRALLKKAGNRSKLRCTSNQHCFDQETNII